VKALFTVDWQGPSIAIHYNVSPNGNLISNATIIPNMPPATTFSIQTEQIFILSLLYVKL
jgi:hypothetical protein